MRANEVVQKYAVPLDIHTKLMEAFRAGKPINDDLMVEKTE